MTNANDGPAKPAHGTAPTGPGSGTAVPIEAAEPDAAARSAPKPERPRDELGRPLPKGSATGLHLEYFEALSLAENQRLAVRYFDEGQFFGAHEAWETCWNQTKGSADEEFYKGLAQLGAGYTHERRGNARGAAALLRRALGRIAAYGPRHHSIDVAALVAAASEHAATMEAAAAAGPAGTAAAEPPPLATPRLAPILEG